MSTTIRIATRMILGLFSMAAISLIFGVSPAGAQSASVSVAPDPAYPGEYVTITGTGFQPGEIVSIEFAGPTLAVGYADASGSFVANGTIDPWVPEGAHPLDANGDLGSWATMDLTIVAPPPPPPTNPSIFFVDGVIAGDSVVISGSDFHGYEDIEIWFAGDLIAATITTGSGDFSVTAWVPANVPVGAHPLDVNGSLGSWVGDDLTVIAAPVPTTTVPPTTTTVPAAPTTTVPATPTTTVPAPSPTTTVPATSGSGGSTSSSTGGGNTGSSGDGSTTSGGSSTTGTGSSAPTTTAKPTGGAESTATNQQVAAPTEATPETNPADDASEPEAEDRPDAGLLSTLRTAPDATVPESTVAERLDDQPAPADVIAGPEASDPAEAQRTAEAEVAAGPALDADTSPGRGGPSLVFSVAVLSAVAAGIAAFVLFLQQRSELDR